MEEVETRAVRRAEEMQLNPEGVGIDANLDWVQGLGARGIGCKGQGVCVRVCAGMNGCVRVCG